MPDMFDAREVTLTEQIEAAVREVRMRRRAYPRWVQTGRMKAETTAGEIAAMQAIIVTLKALQAREAV